MRSRLLILGCSKRKARAAGLMPAIDRYDGPAFKVLRKYLKEEPSNGIRVFVLSAKFGLIPATRKVPDYDFRITRATAEKIRPRVLHGLRKALANGAYLEVGFCLGDDYRHAIEGYEGVVLEGTAVTFIRGGLGTRLAYLYKWLRSDPTDKGRA